MKIEATCDTCKRTFLLAQIGTDSESPGRCPFCGARFARHYSTVLSESVDRAEAAASQFVQALARLQSIETGFDLDLERLVRTVAEQVRSNDTHARPA